MAEARERALTSDEHFTVDGTLVEAWARLKSFKRKDASDGQIPPDDPGNPTSMVARPGMSRLPPRADTEPHRVDGMRVRSKRPLPRVLEQLLKPFDQDGPAAHAAGEGALDLLGLLVDGVRMAGPRGRAWPSRGDQTMRSR